MNSNAEAWKATILVTLISELGIKNKSVFKMMTRLKIVHNNSLGRNDKRDLKARVMIPTNKGMVFFRGRGRKRECEICGLMMEKHFINVHLKVNHDLIRDYDCN
jgi:hypothetical protein